MHHMASMSLSNKIVQTDISHSCVIKWMTPVVLNNISVSGASIYYSDQKDSTELVIFSYVMLF